MNETSSNVVTIHILEKEYVVSCPNQERDALLTSAKYLDERMKEARESGKVLGTERMAVMTALNIVHEFLVQQQEKEAAQRDVDVRIRALKDRLDTALGRRPADLGVD